MLLPKITTIFTLLYFIFITFPHSIHSLRPLSPNSNYCDNKTLIHSQFLTSDQLTVIINGYSDKRIPRLLKIAGNYADSPIVSAVVVIWGNPTTPKETLISLKRNLSTLYTSNSPVKVIPQRTKSLNTRFIPGRWIKTRGVLICDDDIEIDVKSVEFAYNVWRTNQDRLIGLFTRSHAFDLRERGWIYTIRPEKYSIVLTKFMILNIDYLFKYSCGEGAVEEMRNVVDEMNNCEDLLMNFVVADAVEKGPVYVGGVRVRDWGDPRNEAEKMDEVEVGLSGGVRGGGEHRKRRGGCLNLFHRLLGRMPLRYGYGKVVNSVGEQGLCEKKGKLVPCDQELFV